MGRGKYQRLNTKICTNELLCLRLAAFKKQKCLTPGHSGIWHWSINEEEVASVSFAVTDNSIRFMYTLKDEEGNKIGVDKTINLTSTPCNFGGHRQWFCCGCGRKVAVMYIRDQKIACRHCFDAVYPSQREDAIDRQYRKIYKLDDKLKYDRGNLLSWPQKPEGMQGRTYKRLLDKWLAADTKVWGLIASEFPTISLDS